MKGTYVQVNYEDVIVKFQELYPTEFKHAVAEVKADKLEAELSEAHRMLEEATQASDTDGKE